jgi:hypothetical protein
MSIRTFFFIGLSRVTLSFRTDRGEKFADKFLITNDRALITSSVTPYVTTHPCPLRQLASHTS